MRLDIPKTTGQSILYHAVLLELYSELYSRYHEGVAAKSVNGIRGLPGLRDEVLMDDKAYS